MPIDVEKQMVEKIKEMIYARLKGTSPQDIDLLFEDLEKEPLLENHTGVEKILNLIQEKTNGKISWKIKSKYIYFKSGDSVADFDRGIRSSRSKEVEIGFDVHILDPIKLNEYFISVLENKNELKKEMPVDHVEDSGKELDDARIPKLGGENSLKTNIKNGVGYIIFHNKKILIGESNSGKFKLVEILGNESFNKAKNIDTVFETVKVKRDKNKTDSNLGTEYSAPNRKIELMKNYIKEINRMIKNHIRDNKIRNFKFRLSLKSENNKTVWLKEKVGQRV